MYLYYFPSMIDVYVQVVEAVQYCMSMGVLHRDVKDENILIDLKTSQIKLIDFGSGTFLRDDVYTEYEGMYIQGQIHLTMMHGAVWSWREIESSCSG